MQLANQRALGTHERSHSADNKRFRVAGVTEMNMGLQPAKIVGGRRYRQARRFHLNRCNKELGSSTGARVPPEALRHAGCEARYARSPTRDCPCGRRATLRHGRGWPLLVTFSFLVSLWYSRDYVHTGMAPETRGVGTYVHAGGSSYSGVRVGEAKVLGPFSYGGASSSKERAMVKTLSTNDCSSMGHERWAMDTGRDFARPRSSRSETGRSSSMHPPHAEGRETTWENIQCQVCTGQNPQIGWHELRCGCFGMICKECAQRGTKCGWCLQQGRTPGGYQAGRIDFSDWTEVRAEQPNTSWGWPTLIDESHRAVYECQTQGDPIAENQSLEHFREQERSAEQYTDAGGENVASEGESQHQSNSNTLRTAGQGSENQCQSCALPLNATGTTWWICRCTAIYCDECSCEPCGSCGAWGKRGAPVDASRRIAHADGAVLGQGGNSGGLLPPWRRQAPDALHDDRLNELAKAKARRDAERNRLRDLKKRHTKEGKRPRRERQSQENTVKLCTVNATSAISLKTEIETGMELKQFDYLMIQEHGLRGDQRMRVEDWLVKRGWDPALSDAYIKQTDEGGGTGVAASAKLGVRPGAIVPEGLEGRLTLGTIQMGVEVTIGSWYGVTGGDVKKQLGLWQKLAERLNTIGKPFIIGGDWQVRPDEVRASGLPKLLNATVCAPRAATNVRSGRTIDFFLVSDAIAERGWEIFVVHGTKFATHCPVGLEGKGSTEVSSVRRLSTPQVLPATRPHGPLMPTAGVDWDNWQAISRAEKLAESGNDAGDAIAEATLTWYAGAEQELIEEFGICPEEAVGFRGIGTAVRVVDGREQGRFQHTPDHLGIAGHRLAWICRSLHMVALHAATVAEKGIECKEADILTRISHRAGALRKRWRNESAALAKGRGADGNDDSNRHDITEVCEGTQTGLAFLEKLIRRVHRTIPFLVRIMAGEVAEVKKEAAKLCPELEEVSMRLACARGREAKAATRAWAKAATHSLAHKVTKQFSSCTRKSASARKHHQGERTAQEAAECGRNEWAATWKAAESDQSEPILKAIEAMYYVGKLESDHDEILLPPLDAQKIARYAGQFKGGTGIGTDHLRPRHVVYLSADAKAGLARLLGAIERYKRWPDVLREVLERAIGKKSGGSRLVGLATSLYRLWAKCRYADCRAVMETRIARPFLAAAPGRGAEKASFECAWEAEAAHARGQFAATTQLDFVQFFDHIDMASVADGARQMGLPMCVVALIAHEYLGPRRIKVGEATSEQIHPCLSILAGCTWATLCVRLIVIKPVEDLMKLIEVRNNGWVATVNLIIYIDDGVLTTTGERNAVEWIHAWLTRMLIRWVQAVLRQGVAMHKLFCIVPDPCLRKVLRDKLGGTGFVVKAEGELLGGDYAAGGALKQRSALKRGEAEPRKEAGG